MRMRSLWPLAALALLPAVLQAQEPKKDSVAPAAAKSAPTMKLVRLTDRDVNRAKSQLDAELSGKIIIDDDRCKGITDVAARASGDCAVQQLSKTELTNVKNALMVARLDFRDPSRLQGAPEDKTLQVRRMNAEYYRVHEGDLEGILARLVPDRSCTLCEGVH